MRIRTTAELGLLIREQRRKLGLDQQGLAKQVGVSRQWLVEVEQGKPRAEIALVLRTLAALKLQLELSESHEPRSMDAQRGVRGEATASGKDSKKRATPKRPRAKSTRTRLVHVAVDLNALINRARGGREK